MKKFNQEITYPLLMVFAVMVVSFMLLSGCSYHLDEYLQYHLKASQQKEQINTTNKPNKKMRLSKDRFLTTAE